MTKTITVKIAPRTLLFATVLVFMGAQQSFGIPVFARTYKTSCLTCHVAPPKLTPFGEAFRLNGFQIPDDDGESVKEEPLVLGADAYKLVWPKAVWPGSIPGTIPLSFRAKTGFDFSKADTVYTSSFVPPTLQIMLAGTMGEDISFAVGAHLFDRGEFGSMDRLYLQFNNMFSSVVPDYLLYLKVGQFVPEMVPFISNHRSLTLTPYAFNTYTPSFGSGFVAEHGHGDASFGIESFQIGAELSGIVFDRIRYVAGVVGGNGPNALDDNNAKDFYGRIAGKIGGKALSKGGDVASQTGENWVDNSLQLGVFGYKGAKKNVGYISPKDLEFFRVGGDFSLNYGNLNLYGGAIFGQDQHVDKMEDHIGIEEYNLLFAEAAYIVFPWLIPVVRYEQANPTGEPSFGRTIASITVLLHANAKLIAEVPVDIPANIYDARFQQMRLGVDYSF